ncbi:MAG: aldo/keto reductase [Acidimicrobiales bacterium]
MLGYRRIGQSGPEVSEMCVGSYHTYDRMEFEEVVEFLKVAVGAGINFFDVGHYTSAAHPDVPVSRTDVIFGKAKKAAGLRRSEYVHTQKLWYGGTRPSFAQQLDASLPRSGVEMADIVVVNPASAYYFATEVDIPNLVRELAVLISWGRIRSYGLNMLSAEHIALAWSTAEEENLPGPALIQIPYSISQRYFAEDPRLLEIIGDGRTTLEPTNLLETGVLAGRSASEGRERPLGAVNPVQDAQAAMGAVAGVAETFECTSAQLALAFGLCHPLTSSVLFGASSIAQLRENLGAADLYHEVGARAISGAVRDIPHDMTVRKVTDVSQ